MKLATAPLVFFIIYGFMMIDLSCYPQVREPDESPWVNLPSAPLVITEPQKHKRFLTLENKSSGTIIKYSLGCVVKEDSRFKIACNQELIGVNLAPYDPKTGVLEGTIISNTHEIFDICAQQRAKASVVQVDFSDGSLWRIGGQVRACSEAKPKLER